MSKEPSILLGHILECISLVETYLEGINKAAFLTDKKTQDAVLRKLELIGEAVKKLPEDLKNNTSQVPWRKIAGMRDMLIHQYFEVDMELIWDTTQKELKPFKEEIQALLSKKP